MPRPRLKSTLPPLEESLPDFCGLAAGTGKCQAISDALRPVVMRHRQSRNQTFHTCREIARFFGVSQQTATLAVGLLEKEGLLLRIRGARTVVTGARNITRIKHRAVLGFPTGVIERKYSYAHRRLCGDLGDELWKHHIAMDTISYVEIGGKLPDFSRRLHRHELNFAIWLTPLRHARTHMQRLEDEGVRNLVVDFNTATAGFKADVVIDMLRPYVEIARRWRDEFGVRRVHVIEPSDYPRERIATFAAIVRRHGLPCKVLKNTPTLSAELDAAHGPDEKIGIALLDERSTAEFTFWNPSAFVSLARRHRILYGGNYTEVPFAGNGETLIDRIVIDHPRLTEVVSSTLVSWLNYHHAASESVPVVAANADFNVPLWRYL